MILDNPNRNWIYVVPSTPGIWFPHYQGQRITREEYLEHWGKWIIVDDKERLDELAGDLDMAVEQRLIYMIKYLRSAPEIADLDRPLMCVYCDDRERGEVLRLLSALEVMPYGWEYERDMYEHWKPGGEFLERWIALQGLGPEEAERARQECSQEREAWLEYFFVTRERVGRLKKHAPVWSPEDMYKLPAEEELRSMTPIVAIVGRFNVGKSTLFNRLVGRWQAVVADSPGTTRDRIYADTSWGERNFTLMDSGGLESEPDSGLGRKAREQVELALEEADAVVFLVDGQEGVTPSDEEIARVLQRRGKPVVLAANKAEQQRKHADAALPFRKLGLGEPFLISARYGMGLTELKNELTARFPPSLPHLDKSSMMKLAIAGRLNVGKSTLLNALLEQERAVAEETPGTTRDATDTVFYYTDNEPVLLIDTAGLRRRSETGGDIERRSMLQTRAAMRRADIVLFVLDAVEPVTPQDIRAASQIRKASRPVLIVVNKWDLAKDPGQGAMERIKKEIREQLKFPPNTPTLFVSAKFKQGSEGVLPTSREILGERMKRVSTSALNDELERMVAAHPPPSVREKSLDIFYAVQGEVDPPTFVFFVSDRTLARPSYRRYLENELHRRFGFAGVPLRLVFKDIA